MNKMLGSRIRELRIAREYTQEQVAEKLGISRRTLHRKLKLYNIE